MTMTALRPHHRLDRSANGRFNTPPALLLLPRMILSYRIRTTPAQKLPHHSPKHRHVPHEGAPHLRSDGRVSFVAVRRRGRAVAQSSHRPALHLIEVEKFLPQLRGGERIETRRQGRIP